MSFDVEFHATSQTTAKAQSNGIRDLLLTRPHYRENGQGLIYARESTGVYGTWDFPAIDQEEADAPVAVLAINYLLPGFFAVELAREIAEVQVFFKLAIHDPQSGQDHAPQDGAKAIVPSYMDHAGRAARTTASHSGAPPLLTLPRNWLTEVWRWNDSRDRLQEIVGDDVFVPTIMLARTAGGLSSAVVWTDGIPMLIPKVDMVLVFRHLTAPKQGILRRRTPIVEVLTHSDFVARFQAFSTPFPDWPASILFGHDDPAGLRRLATVQPIGNALRFADNAWRKQTELLPMDSVMDAEFLRP